MKKIVLAIAVAGSVVSCKKVPEGGNKNIIKMEEGASNYRDDEMHGGAESGSHTAADSHKTQVTIPVKGVELTGYANGLEERIVKFLESGAYQNAADDAALKDVWYDFDNVNFKMGASKELEAGSEGQIQNLAKILKAYPEAKIKIGGYTDKTGNEVVNQKISQDRANFIKSELTKLGVGNQVVTAEGYGSKFATVAAEASNDERAVDRKMAVRFTK